MDWRDFGRERAARPAATSGAAPDMTAKRAMNGGASNCLWPPFTWLLIGCYPVRPSSITNWSNVWNGLWRRNVTI